jgi:predicted Zn-ribbon and HTH transcriptional regulator
MKTRVELAIDWIRSNFNPDDEITFEQVQMFFQTQALDEIAEHLHHIAVALTKKNGKVD